MTVSVAVNSQTTIVINLTLPCDRLVTLSARPAVTFTAAEHHHRMTSTKLYCLVTEAHVCERLAESRYMKVEQAGVEPVDRESDTLAITPQRQNIQPKQYNHLN